MYHFWLEYLNHPLGILPSAYRREPLSLWRTVGTYFASSLGTSCLLVYLLGMDFCWSLWWDLILLIFIDLRSREMNIAPIFIWCFFKGFTPLRVVKMPSASTLVFSLELLRGRIPERLYVLYRQLRSSKYTVLAEKLYVFILLENCYSVKRYWST